MAGNFDKRRRSVEDILSGSGGGVDWWDDVAPAGDDFEPIPPGTYRCVLTDGRVAESTTGKASFKLEFTIVGGPHANRRLWHDCWLTREAGALSRRDLEKIGIRRPEQLRLPPPTGILADVKVALRARDDGTQWNRVAAFQVVGDAPPPMSLAPEDEDDEAGPDTDTVPF